ncbi:hypothetical protein BaOVIS_004690 [Babesia ovis]|uniref:Uncharacterized protein n=1 Tax=Babesia ovis TaxID=5869 RepID=A0A9W5T875_BABOV|nr:hypothetical protein BaOVIS_004690 [Babesia ovis]
MRRIFLKRAYRDAVSWFGSENYRKAFKCTPSIAVLQAGSHTFRNPFLMRMGTMDEVREALRLKIGSQQSLWDGSLGLTGVGYGVEVLLPYRSQHSKLRRQLDKIQRHTAREIKTRMKMARNELMQCDNTRILANAKNALVVG